MPNGACENFSMSPSLTELSWEIQGPTRAIWSQGLASAKKRYRSAWGIKWLKMTHVRICAVGLCEHMNF